MQGPNQHCGPARRCSPWRIAARQKASPASRQRRAAPAAAQVQDGVLDLAAGRPPTTAQRKPRGNLLLLHVPGQRREPSMRAEPPHAPVVPGRVLLVGKAKVKRTACMASSPSRSMQRLTSAVAPTSLGWPPFMRSHREHGLRHQSETPPQTLWLHLRWPLECAVQRVLIQPCV